MKKGNIYTALMLFLMITGAGYLQGQPVAEKKTVTEKLYIDPANARGGSAIQFFDTVAFIPLESTRESIFGEIWKMEVTEDYYIISDMNTNAVLIFQKNGKFHAKITGKILKGRIAPDFTVDQEQRRIILTVSGMSKKLYWLDFDGKLIKTTAIPEYPFSMASLNAATLLYSPWVFVKKAAETDSVNYHIKYLDDSTVVKQFLPFHPRTVLTGGITLNYKPNCFYYSGLRGNLLFVGENNYNIQVLNDTGLQKVYSLVFPLDKSLPVGFRADKQYEKSPDAYFRDHPAIIHSLRNVYLAPNSLLFETVKGTFFDNDRLLAYNLRTGNIISLRRISSDSSSCFLPFFAMNGGILASDHKCIYATVSSMEMFREMELNKSRRPVYPPGLQTYFDRESRKSNPVIVQLQLKENF